MVVFRHLMGTPHRRALFGHLDKLFDERVLLGSGIAAKEALRYVKSICMIMHFIQIRMSTEPMYIRQLQISSITFEAS